MLTNCSDQRSRVSTQMLSQKDRGTVSHSQYLYTQGRKGHIMLSLREWIAYKTGNPCEGLLAGQAGRLGEVKAVRRKNLRYRFCRRKRRWIHRGLSEVCTNLR